MSNRIPLDNRLRTALDPFSLIGRLGKALGVAVPELAQDIVNQPFPDITSKSFREEYLCREILRKYPGFQLGINTRQAALTGFLEQEERNRETNERLTSHRASVSTDVARIFYAAARKATNVLGEFNWTWFLDGVRFGPGTTTSKNCREADLVSKLSGKLDCTPAASKLAYAVLQQCPQWAYSITQEVELYSLLRRVDVDRIHFVPKNAKTDRLIAIQPDANIVLQLGVAYVMRKRLQKWGINLNCQSINQDRARAASRDGVLATIDLSNASNSMTCSLVWKMIGDHPYIGHICDPTWYRLFEALRTERGIIDDSDNSKAHPKRVHTYELFSAMGNGYTFELESLIFWSLAHETCVHLGIVPDVTVYGDDIILPTEAVDLFQQVLMYAGFTMNAEKSFFGRGEAIFRESCGGHYLNGRDVTPIYCTDVLDTVEAVVLLANNLVRWAKLPWGLDGRIRPIYNWVVNHLPRAVQATCIPYGEDNDGLIKNFDQATPSIVRRLPLKCRVKTSHPEKWIPHTSPFFGFKATTFKLTSRGTIPRGGRGLTVWHYLKAYKVFKWPTAEEEVYNKVVLHQGDALTVIAHRLYVLLHFSEPPQSYQVPSIKRDMALVRRMVPSWTDPGPWLD